MVDGFSRKKSAAIMKRHQNFDSRRQKNCIAQKFHCAKISKRKNFNVQNFKAQKFRCAKNAHEDHRQPLSGTHYPV